MVLQRKTRVRASILALLQDGPRTLHELMQLTHVSRPAVITTISRLRDRDWQIVSETTGESRNPRYILLGGPQGMMGAAFICPACKHTIRLGHVEDHAVLCQFGPLTLRELQADPGANQNFSHTLKRNRNNV